MKKDDLQKLLYDLACDWRQYTHGRWDCDRTQRLSDRLRDAGVIDDRGWGIAVWTRAGIVHFLGERDMRTRCGRYVRDCRSEVIPARDAMDIVTCSQCRMSLRKQANR